MFVLLEKKYFYEINIILYQHRCTKYQILFLKHLRKNR